MEKRYNQVMSGQFGEFFVEQREFNAITGVWGEWQIVADFPTLDKAIDFVKLGGKKITRRIFNYITQCNVAI